MLVADAAIDPFTGGFEAVAARAFGIKDIMPDFTIGFRAWGQNIETGCTDTPSLVVAERALNEILSVGSVSTTNAPCVCGSTTTTRFRGDVSVHLHLRDRVGIELL